MDLEFNVTGINFMRKIRNREDKRDKYLPNLNTCGNNCLKMTKEIPKRGFSPI